MFPVVVVIAVMLVVKLLAAGKDRAAPAEDFCAVRVLVSDRVVGRPSGLLVRLLDSSGKEVARAETWQGEASFCDFGFGEHTIVVGRDEECGRVTIHGIRLARQTQLFEVVRNHRAVPPSGGYPPACLVYFRVSSRAGTKPRASVQTRSGYVLAETDKYGRAWFGALEGRTEEYVVVSPGHEPARVVVRCEGQRDVEQEVILTPLVSG